MSQASNANGMIGENLTLLNIDRRSADERRLVQLYERAQLLLRDDALIFGDNRTEEFAALFSEPEEVGTLLDGARGYIAVKDQTEAVFDKLTVCKFAAQELEKRGDLLERLVNREPLGTAVNIAYFRNAYADAAFRVFSRVLDNPTVTYASDFTAVCEEVYYERSDMCLLPLDSSRDSKLVSFYKLIEKYELAPVYSCDVATPDGSVTTRYALLKRAVSVPEREKRSRDGGCMLEFNLSPDESMTLSDVLGAAKSCGLTLYKVDSLPSTYSEGTFTYDVILNVGDAAGLDAFMLFLTLAVPQYELLGIYPHIRA